MYKNVLQNIDNIAIWPVISFIIFFAFFLGLLWWTIKVDRKFITHMSNLPVDDQSSIQSSETQPEKL